MSDRPSTPPAPSDAAAVAVVQDAPPLTLHADLEALRGSLVARMHRDEAKLLHVVEQAHEHANWGLLLQATDTLRRLHELEAKVTGVLTIAPSVTTNVAIVTDSPRDELMQRLAVIRERHSGYARTDGDA